MRKLSKRRTPSRSSSNKTAKQNKTAAQKTAHELVKPKRGTQPQPHPSSAKQTKRTESILAMLRAPSGVTIDAMMHATGWQQHSVRGFLAGVVRKKLGLNLASAATEGGRLYRITDRTASGAA
jgi:hypothetical protein